MTKGCTTVTKYRSLFQIYRFSKAKRPFILKTKKLKRTRFNLCISRKLYLADFKTKRKKIINQSIINHINSPGKEFLPVRVHHWRPFSARMNKWMTFNEYKHRCKSNTPCLNHFQTSYSRVMPAKGKKKLQTPCKHFLFKATIKVTKMTWNCSENLAFFAFVCSFVCFLVGFGRATATEVCIL